MTPNSNGNLVRDHMAESIQQLAQDNCSLYAARGRPVA